MQTLKLHGVPGGGKTHTLLQFFQEELKTVKPNRIVFLTFTRAARLEALSRTGLTEEELPFVKTIHATCYKSLNLEQSQLVMRRNLVSFGKALGVHLTGFVPDLFSLETGNDQWQQPTKADRLLQLNHLGRHRGVHLKEALRDAPQELDYHYAKWFTQAYRDWKESTGLSDYTDLLTRYIEKGQPIDADVMFVDEAQDLSWLQWQVVHKLGANCQRAYLCGDPDQTIFRWAGASSSMFDLEPANETRSLPHSYRLSKIVHQIGQKIIKRIRVRYDKEFTCRDSPGEYRPVGQLGLEHVDSESTLVLYRNFHRGTALSMQLEELGVPFSGANAALSSPDVGQALAGWGKLKNHQPLPMNEAKAMWLFASAEYLTVESKALVEAKSGEVSATAIFKPATFDSPFWKVLPKLPRLSYITRCMARHELPSVLKPKVQLLSIHQSKGREAHTVVLDLEMARRTYEAYLREPDDEHRCQYVAVTRAKERLLTLMPGDSQSYVI